MRKIATREFYAASGPRTAEIVTDMDAVESLLNQCQLLLMDFDGVFADTEPLHARAYAAVLEGLGVPFCESDFPRYIGRTESEIWAMLAQEFHLVISPVELGKKRVHEFMNLVNSKRLKPSWFINPLLSYAVDSVAVRTIVVSSQQPRLIRRLLHIWGLTRYHFELATVYNRGRSKADLLKTLPPQEGIPFKKCLLVEDSSHVLALARETGMKTIGVRHSLNDLHPEECDLLLNMSTAREIP
jgi:beta-phosphoglucomutase-like phosphatase (HAD superfamily)